MPSDTDAAVSLRAAWDEMIARLQRARTAVDDPSLYPPPASGRNLAEGYRYLLGFLYGAIERASQTASDPDVRSWAASELPTLREHLALARDVNSQLVLGPTPAPAAIPTAVLVPWCGGAFVPGSGTNFGTCAAVVK